MCWWWVATALAQPLTLTDALQEALVANPELRIGALDLQSSEASLLRTAGVFDPSLSVGVDTSASNSPTTNALAQVPVVRSTSNGLNASVNQYLPTGGNASLSWFETALDSNDRSLVGTRTASSGVSLSVSQPLLSGLGALGPIRSARLALSDAELARRAAVEQAMLDVSAAYWRLVSAIRSLDLAENSVQIAEQSLADTRERFAEGFAGTGDVLQVERAVGTAAGAEVVARAEVEAAEQALRRVLGRPVTGGEPIEPVDAPEVLAEAIDRDQILALARSGNAQWLRDQLALEQAELSARLIRNGALPNLAVNGSVGASGLGTRGDARVESRNDALTWENNNWSVGASMSVPLPGRTLRADWTQARIQAESARIRAEAAEQDLILRVESALRQVERDRSRSQLAAETVRVARLALEADQELLSEGKGSTRDVVISLEALDQATASELGALIDLQRSQLELKRVAGTLLE